MVDGFVASAERRRKVHFGLVGVAGSLKIGVEEVVESVSESGTFDLASGLLISLLGFNITIIMIYKRTNANK